MKIKREDKGNRVHVDSYPILIPLQVNHSAISILQMKRQRSQNAKFETQMFN